MPDSSLFPMLMYSPSCKEMDQFNFHTYRPTTPPDSDTASRFASNTHSRNTSSSSFCSAFSSPEAYNTQLLTPIKSPIRQNGPTLLPKIRPQDQSVASVAEGALQRHRKALSITQNPPAMSSFSTVRPVMQRSVTEPVECFRTSSPAQAFTPLVYLGDSCLNSPLTYKSSHSRKSSVSHSRNTSSSSIDESTLRRYGYPNYRPIPTYITNDHPASQLSPQPPTDVLQTHLGISPRYSLPAELQYAPTNADWSTSNLMDYLSKSTQAVNLVRQLNINPGPGLQSYFWWDVRNLRTWGDFNIQTISEVPGMMELLHCDLPGTATPSATISSSRLQPESEASLIDVCNDIYATKVNAALKVTQGQDHIALRKAESAQTREGPHFVANYWHDNECTANGAVRGRVLGLVKSFDRWNTGMRHETPIRKVQYLQGLSHLQRCMREHNCRYGFILTEIELICVRAGTEEVPYFGHLELAPSIETSAASGSSMTVSLALWWLCTLAKENPLSGQCSWRLDVGSTGALTRQRILGDKDSWIPEPQMSEKRLAKRVRGWVMPKDPWHKREGKRRVMHNK